MPEELNPGEKVKKANGDYHEAVQGVLLDESLPVQTKVEFAHEAKNAFNHMAKANEIIAAHYEQEA